MKALLPVLACALFCGSAYAQPSGASPDVLFQGFHWNVHPGDHATNTGGVWWDSVATVAPRLAAGGVQTVWIPSPAKGGSGRWSMGYDPYDYYDLGSIDQKGSIRTRFGSEAQLRSAVAAMKGSGLRIMADVILNHRDGADAQSNVACVPGGGSPFLKWNVFNPLSNRFPAGPDAFHSNTTHCDFDAPYHDAPFGQDICYFHDYDNVLDASATNNGWYHGQQGMGATADSLVVWGRWLMDDLGADEVRLDAIKHIDPAFLAPWVVELASGEQPFALGENWSSTGEIIAYHDQVESYNSTFGSGGKDANMAMFDFGLRYALRDMANGGGSYDMQNLNGAGLHFGGLDPFDVVTFVENHDVDRVGWQWADCSEPEAVQTGSTCVKPGIDSGHDPIVSRKNMAYAVIMASEGRPTVYWKDYIWFGLGDEIDWLMALRRQTGQGESTPMSGLNPGGGSFNLGDLWALKREGNPSGARFGMVLALNDASGGEQSTFVNTPHTEYELKDYSDAFAFETTTAFADSRALVKARGGDYAWWAPTGLYPRPIDEPDSAFDLTSAPGGKLHHVVLRASDAQNLVINGAPIQPGDQVAVLAPGATAASGADVAGIGRVGQRMRWDGVHDMVIEVLGNGTNIVSDASRLNANDALRLVVYDADTEQTFEAGSIAWASGGTSFTFNPLRPASRGGAFGFATNDDDGQYTDGAVSLVTAFAAGAATPPVVLAGEAGWRMMALPYPDLGLGGSDPANQGGAITPGLLQPIYTAGYAGADIDEDGTGGFANVFLYEESDSSYPLPATSTSVPTGRGFWLYAFADDNPFMNGVQGTFPKVLPASGTPLATDHNFGVAYTSSAPFRGGHLLGNPYDQDLDWDHSGWTKTKISSTIYVYDPGFNGGDYLAWTTGVGGTLKDGAIPVGQGFFVYAVGSNPSLVAPAAARMGSWSPLNGFTAPASSGEENAKSEDTLPHVRLTLAGRVGESDRSSTLSVAVAPEASLGLDTHDALALAPASGADAFRLVAVTPEAQALMVSAVPGEATVSVHAEAITGGIASDADAVLSWEPVALPNGWIAILTDHARNQSHDLTASGEIRLQLSASDAALELPAAPEAAKQASAGAPRFEPLTLSGADDARFTITLRPAAATGTEEQASGALTLGAPQPNPARGSTVIPFTLNAAAPARLVLYDALGREVRILLEGSYTAGTHEAVLDTEGLASGVYVVQLSSGATTQSQRLTVIR